MELGHSSPLGWVRNSVAFLSGKPREAATAVTEEKAWPGLQNRGPRLLRRGEPISQSACPGWSLGTPPLADTNLLCTGVANDLWADQTKGRHW